jgi:acyl carrier protein
MESKTEMVGTRGTEIEQRLRKLVLARLDGALRESDIRPDTSLYGKGLGLDSIDVVALIVSVEEEFDVFFDAEEVGQSVETFGTLLATIHQKLEGADASR